MLIFIYGENDFLALGRLNQLKNKFVEKFGDFNLIELDVESSELKAQKLAGEVETVPFLSQKRMIVVKNLLKNLKADEQKEFVKIVKRIPSSTILVIYEKEEPDKRSALFKHLLKADRVFSCRELKGQSLISWIEQEVEKNRGKISRQATSRLAFISKGNLWRLSQEINKLVNYTYPQEIKIEDINLLVKEDVEAKAFDLVDSLSEKNLNKSMNILRNLLENGENELYLLTMIIYGFRNLTLVKYASESKKKTSKLKIHPFVFNKTKQQINRYKFCTLRRIYKRLLEVDEKIKKGLLEPTLALDLLVVDLCLGKI